MLQYNIVGQCNENSFFEGENDVLLDMGFKTKHIYCTVFSTCSSVHFTFTFTFTFTKRQQAPRCQQGNALWQNSNVDFSDDVSSSLMLLQHLDCDITTSSNSKK